MPEPQADLMANTGTLDRLIARMKAAESEIASLRSVTSAAFDKIAAAVGCPTWEYPGQLVRDVQALAEERDRLRAALAITPEEAGRAFFEAGLEEAEKFFEPAPTWETIPPSHREYAIRWAGFVVAEIRRRADVEAIAKACGALTEYVVRVERQEPHATAAIADAMAVLKRLHRLMDGDEADLEQILAAERAAQNEGGK